MGLVVRWSFPLRRERPVFCILLPLVARVARNVLGLGTTSQWKEARGRAYFLDSQEIGSLKVSFFGPFYGRYHVCALDPDYRWALVAGYDHDYLWILVRERQLPPDVLEDLLARAQTAGVATDVLIFPRGAAP